MWAKSPWSTASTPLPQSRGCNSIQSIRDRSTSAASSRMEAHARRRRFVQTSPKRVLLALKGCQSVTQDTAVMSLLDGSYNRGDLALHRRISALRWSMKARTRSGVMRSAGGIRRWPVSSSPSVAWCSVPMSARDRRPAAVLRSDWYEPAIGLQNGQDSGADVEDRAMQP